MNLKVRLLWRLMDNRDWIAPSVFINRLHLSGKTDQSDFRFDRGRDLPPALAVSRAQVYITIIAR